MGASESKGRDENGEAKESSGAALAAGAIAGAAAILALGAGVVSLMGESSKPDEEKTMKAPGRDMRIPRSGFEENPAGYFQELRNDKRKK